MGCKYDKANQHYLQTFPRYLYNEKNQGGHADHITLEDWAEEWTCCDKSSKSPQQRNVNKCGILTLVSLALLSQGTRL